MAPPRYRVIITGQGIFIPAAQGGEPARAFATTRFVRASTEEEASALALASVKRTWEAEPEFKNSPRPELAVAFIARVRSPLKRSRPNAGHSFVHDTADLPEAIEIEKAASSGWLL